MKLVCPPVPEQREIVEFINKETAGLNSAIARLKREVELIREYRTRLVADVVSGQLDVRAAAAHLLGEAGELEPGLGPEEEEEAETTAAENTPS
jgi:type I restriction enzyme S subunit